MDAAVAIIRAKTPHSALLILRRALNPSDPWSGHFAFPGGRRDPGDLDLFDTCVRETREECGLELTRRELVTELPVVEAGNALGTPVRVVPFVFEIPSERPLRLDPVECAAAHWVSEAYLRDPAHRGVITPLPDPARRFPAILLDGGHVWGFTYKVVEEVLSIRQ